MKTKQEIFEHYITNPQAEKRESWYWKMYFVVIVLYFIWVAIVYKNPEGIVQLVGPFPLFAIVTWIFNTGYYIYGNWIKGKWLVDVETEQAEGWDKIQEF